VSRVGANAGSYLEIAGAFWRREEDNLMTIQGLDRRSVLEMLAKAASASQFPGFSRWAYGAEHKHEESSLSASRQPYTPLYFSRHQYKTIEILTDLIIPAGETPGAKDAGVSEFIDFMAAHGENELRQPMLKGLGWLDTISKKTYGSVFARLSGQQQAAVFKIVAYSNQAFFKLIRRYTTMGYYTSGIGLKELNFPGLRLYTHTNGPKHLQLHSASI